MLTGFGSGHRSGSPREVLKVQCKAKRQKLVAVDTKLSFDRALEEFQKLGLLVVAE
jgi:hypothetical protein